MTQQPHVLVIDDEPQILRAIRTKAGAAGLPSVQSDLAPHDRQVPLASFLDLARTMGVTPGFEALGTEVIAILERESTAELRISSGDFELHVVRRPAAPPEPKPPG